MDMENTNLFEFAEFDELESEHIAAPRYSYWKSVWRTFFKNKFTVAVAVLLLCIIAFALIQPMLSGYSPIKTPNINNSHLKFLKPSAEHIFGTDHVGNEVFDAVWAGARNSIIVRSLQRYLQRSVPSSGYDSFLRSRRRYEISDYHHDLYRVDLRSLLHTYAGHDHP